MQGARLSFEEEPQPYDVHADLYRIFHKDMHRLYALAFLLTASQVMAEECFVQSLDESTEDDRILKQGLKSRVTWTIVRNAIQMRRPKPGDGLTERLSSDYNSLNQFAEFSAVVGLPAFERFVFVLSVLERYTDQECSSLLHCSLDDVVAARAQALRSMVQCPK